MTAAAATIDGTSSFEVKPGSGYPIIPGETYTNNSTVVPGEFDDSRFIITDTHGEDYIAFCADYLLSPPKDPDGHTQYAGGERASWLAVGIASPEYGAMLSNSQFNALFGLTGSSIVSDPVRAAALSAFVWAMETTKDISVAVDLTKWPTSLNSLKTSMTNRGIATVYGTIANGISTLISAYDPDGTGGISGIKTSYNDATGRLTVTRTGTGTPSLGLTVT